MIYNYLERFIGVGKTSDTTKLQDYKNEKKTEYVLHR